MNRLDETVSKGPSLDCVPGSLYPLSALCPVCEDTETLGQMECLHQVQTAIRKQQG